MRQRTMTLLLTVLLGLGTLFGTGCATKKYVQSQVQQEVGASETRTEERISEVENQVEQTQTRVEDQDRRLGEASKTARDAYDRALAAGKLAEGKFLYETTLTSDQVRFAFEKAELNEDSAAALDTFAQQVKADNKNVFIEIQGHTDASGPDSVNDRLGLERAEAVRRYLSQKHGFPLHRMSVISYGESEPVGDNKTREGRAQNRRVVLVVLQ